MTTEFVIDGELTQEGKQLAGTMFQRQCDRIPCSMCSHQNRQTGGPGGDEGCPATGSLTTRAEVDEVLTAYLGREPGLEALDSLLGPKQ